MRPSDVHILLHYCKYVLNHKGVQAQHLENGYWLGCYIVDTTSGQVQIEIANGDRKWVGYDEVRIPGI